MTRNAPCNQELDFARVKATASFEAVLQQFDISFVRRGDERVARCPFHEDAVASLSANVVRNVFHCFGCGAKGSVLDFVARLDGCTLRAAAARVVRAGAAHATGVSSGRSAADGKRVSQSANVTGPNPPLHLRLSIDAQHPYLARWGLATATVRHFGLGFASVGVMKGRIAIPIHDERGELGAYAGRWAGDDGTLPEGEGKYKLPSRFRKSLILWNLHRVPSEAKTVVIVEGYFQAIAVHVAGFPNVVALMGSTLSRAQQTLLLSRFTEVTLFLDGDAAGRAATETIRQQLESERITRVAWCPQGRQPDTLDAAEIQELLR